MRKLLLAAAWLQTIRKRLFLVAGCVVVALLLLSGLALLRVYLSMQRPKVTRENWAKIYDSMPKADVYALLGPPENPPAFVPAAEGTGRVEFADWVGSDCAISLMFSLEQPQVVVHRAYGSEGRTFSKWLLWHIRHPFGLTR